MVMNSECSAKLEAILIKLPYTNLSNCLTHYIKKKICPV